MRRLFLFAAFASLLVTAHATEAEFARVWTQWRDNEAFDRIGEYFGEKENTDKNIVLRTHTETRAGYYFLVRVQNSTALSGTKFELQVIRPDAPEPKTFSFPADVRAGGAAFQLGLTATDWPGGKAAHPVAWKLALLAADGRVLAEQKSFLWEKPAK